MKKFNAIFKEASPVIAMIHLDALPGTPAYQNNWQSIADKALLELEIYQKAGVDAIIIENMHDLPYLNKDIGPEIIACMTVVAQQISHQCSLPIGIQILSSANQAALAVAKAAQLQFIRSEGFVFGHLADEGWINSDAGHLLRYRKSIDADHIAVFTDIKKKHSAHAMTADIDIVETAKAASYFLSDGLIITGMSTGKEAPIDAIHAIKQECTSPVIVGSGLTYDNLPHYLDKADALIVGSYFKVGGYWANALSYDRTAAFMEKARKLRS